MRILLVEPDHDVGHKLLGEMRIAGLRPSLATSSERALAALQLDAFDMVLLNHMPPDLSRPQWLARLQSCRNAPAIIFPPGNENLEQSAASTAEMLLKRLYCPSSPKPGRLAAADLTLDPATHEVWRAGQPITLTDKEFRLLRILLEHRGEVVGRDVLLAKVWGYTFDPRTNLIEVHISKLRSKIDQPFATKLLKTVRSSGYLIR